MSEFWGGEMSEFGGGKCPNFGGGKCPPELLAEESEGTKQLGRQ